MSGWPSRLCKKRSSSLTMALMTVAREIRARFSDNADRPNDLEVFDHSRNRLKGDESSNRNCSSHGGLDQVSGLSIWNTIPVTTQCTWNPFRTADAVVVIKKPLHEVAPIIVASVFPALSG